MRLHALAWTAFALTAGCLRFGYEAVPNRLDGGFDSGMMRPDAAASVPDAAANSSMDAAVRRDAAAADAGQMARDASGHLDAGKPGPVGRDSGTADSGTRDSGTGPRDSGTTDSGTTDSGTTDSGTTDSGTTDSGTTDPIDPSWTQDCPGDPGILFCDDFEVSLAKWSYPVQSRGTTARSTNHARASSYALRATTSASTSSVQSQARQGVKAFAHRKSGDLWARYYYFLPSSVSLTDKFSSGVISEYEAPYLGFSVLIFPDGIGIESGATSRKVNTTFPRNQWVCIEMHVLIDASAGRFEFFMNGAPITSLIKTNTLPAHGYTSFEVGVHYANFNQGPIDVYTDDVVLGTKQLGCN